MPPKSELLKGTLEMLILRTLTAQTMHGYALAQQIEQRSHHVLTLPAGSLYPALERLQKKGQVKSKWGETPAGRKARYYTITAAGRKMLGEEIANFDHILAAISRVMRKA